MLIGIIFYNQVSNFSTVTPYLIGIMLFLTYCNINYRQIKFSKFHFILLATQLVGSIFVYLIFLPFNSILAQGAMICILAPTATAAPVITNILGGNMESLSTYSLLCNITIAIVAPICFALTGNVDANSFGHAVAIISKNTFVLLIFPFILAYLLKKATPTIHTVVKSWKFLSLYLWSISLTIITGQTISFVLKQSTNFILEIMLATIAFIICCLQFLTGRLIGKKYDNIISGGQGLGQKNTILAIWMAQTYLSPISSIAPGAYVLWQNMINSYQVWKSRKEIREEVSQDVDNNKRRS